MRRFDVFFEVSVNIMLTKKSNCRLFEMPLRTCDVTVIKISLREDLHQTTYYSNQVKCDFCGYVQKQQYAFLGMSNPLSGMVL